MDILIILGFDPISNPINNVYGTIWVIFCVGEGEGDFSEGWCFFVFNIRDP